MLKSVLGCKATGNFFSKYSTSLWCCQQRDL